MNPPQHDAGITGPLHMQAGSWLVNTSNNRISHCSMICPQIGANMNLTALSYIRETALSLGKWNQAATATPMAHTSVKNKAGGDTK